MITSRKLRFFALVFLISIVIVVSHSGKSTARGGISPDFAGKWRYFSTSDGLNSKKIEAVTQDRYGNLWVGTDEGLQKFSSERPWPTFIHERILTLFTDGQDIIWVGTESGLHSVDKNGVTSYPFPDKKKRKVYSIWRSSEGEIWCGTDDGVWVLKEEKWTRSKGLPQGVKVFSICSTNKTPLAGTEGALYGFTNGKWRSFSVPVLPKDAAVSSILVTRNGDIWLGTDRGVVLHATEGDWEKPIRLVGIPSGPGKWKVRKMLEDDDGSIWVATDGYGVYHLRNSKVVDHLTSSTGLSASYVKDILKDSEGGLWFATAAGLDRYDRATWSYYVPNRSIGSIVSGAKTPSGDLLLASYRTGIFKFDGKSWKQCYPINGTLSVTSVAAAPNGNIWVGTEDNGIIQLSKSCRVMSRKLSVNGENLETVTTLLVTPKGELWVGTNSGVFRHSGKTWNLYFPADYGARQNAVRALAVDQQGRIWIGTEDGSLEMFDGRWHKALVPDNSGIPRSKGIQSIAFPKNGGMWLGLLDAGAVFYDGKTWKRFGDEVLPSKDVFSVYSAPNGQVWVGTNGGVGRFDGNVWITYTRANGLPDNEVSWIGGGKDGCVWFGNPSGVIIRYTQGKTPPKVSIESVNGKRDFKKPLSIQPNEAISIGFFGIDTKTSASSLYYRYMLIGAEDGWSIVRGVTPRAYYNSLKPGKYEFVVQAIDGDLLYSDPAKLEIIVQSPKAVFTIQGITLPKITRTVILIMGTLLFFLISYLIASKALRKGKASEAIRRHFNPYIAGTPVSDERTFFGREDILKGLISTIHRNNVMILGERRIGKTSLLQYLTKELKKFDDPEYFFVPLYIDLEGVSEKRFFHFLAEEIYMELESAGYSVPPSKKMLIFQKDSKSYTDRDFRRDLKAIIEELKKEAGQKHLRLILLLDEVDVMGSYSSQTQQLVRRLFMESFSQYLGMVVAGVRINKAWDRVESPWYNMFTQIELLPLKRKEAEQLIREPVKGVYSFDDDAVEFIWEQSKGKPFYIQQLCMESVNTMLRDREKKGRITLKHVTTAYNRLLSTDKTLSSRP